ncbi:putative zinc finger protein 84-like [Microtus ochrogaster]|uniref:Putative zinc finger protein 84-like n=1 Tax=Microtus ochrogaster TaxID=79684 RepID=A0A8J6G0I7_MICOH|nr:putative zinc finger protein 84-like [Microtus ochrogaster]
MSFSGNQIQLEDCPITSGGDRTSCCSQTMTPNADQTCHEHKEMALSGDQPLCRSLMRSPSGELLNYGAQTMDPNTSKTFCEGQMTSTSDSMDRVETTLPIGNQTIFGGQMTPTSDLSNGVQTTSTGNQTSFGGEMTPTNDPMDGVEATLPIGNQTFFGGQKTTPSGHQTPYRTQMMPCEGNQALYRSQNITPSVDQAQMATLHGDQTLHGSQMTKPRGDQTYDPQMTNPRGGLTHYTGQVMSLVTLMGSQLHFQDRSPSISNSHLAQEQLTECSSSFPSTARNLTVVKEEDLMTWASELKKRKNWKTYKCKQCGQLFIRTSHLRWHIRKHTGVDADFPTDEDVPFPIPEPAAPAALRRQVKLLPLATSRLPTELAQRQDMAKCPPSSRGKSSQ